MVGTSEDWLLFAFDFLLRGPSFLHERYGQLPSHQLLWEALAETQGSWHHIYDVSQRFLNTPFKLVPQNVACLFHGLILSLSEILFSRWCGRTQAWWRRRVWFAYMHFHWHIKWQFSEFWQTLVGIQIPEKTPLGGGFPLPTICKQVKPYCNECQRVAVTCRWNTDVDSCVITMAFYYRAFHMYGYNEVWII